jgi:hypothetical protein
LRHHHFGSATFTDEFPAQMILYRASEIIALAE